MKWIVMLAAAALLATAHETVIAQARPQTRAWSECSHSHWGGAHFCRRCWIDTLTRQRQCSPWSSRWEH